MSEDAYSSRVLITGATGFIASWVQQLLLQRGHDVVGTSRYDHRPEGLFVLGDAVPRLERGDPREVESLRPIFTSFLPDVVIHLDAYVNPVALKTDPLRSIEYNFMETVNLLELCREFGTSRLVFASSIAVLPTIRYEPIDAAHPIVTSSEGPAGGFYGASKAASELFGLTYADSFGLDFRIIRPSAVYGLGMQWPVGVKPIVEGIVRGEEVTVYVNTPLRDFTPVQDAAAIFAAAAIKDDVADRVFFAGTGRALTSGQGLLDAVRTAFPHAALQVNEEPLDPSGVESRYRGVLDVTPVREQLGVHSAFDSLVDGLLVYAEQYGQFLASPLAHNVRAPVRRGVP